jgi:hypothetical protein
MSTPAVSAERVIVALRRPVALEKDHGCVATSTELPFDERWYCSVMFRGASQLSRAVEAPTKTSSVLVERGVVEGAFTVVERAVARVADAAIGLPLRTSSKAVIPPLSS